MADQELESVRYTVDATYKGRLYKGQLLIRVHFEKYGFFPISRVQIFAFYKGTKNASSLI